MSRRSLLLVVLLLATSSTSAAVVVLGNAEEVPGRRYGPMGTSIERSFGAVSGDRMLVAWNRGEGAVRVDGEGRPLDVPAMRLPKPTATSGADVVADGDGWMVGWTVFPINQSPSMLRLVRVTREGEVEDLRKLHLQHEVGQNEPMHLAMRNGVFVAAYPFTNDGRHIAIVTASATHVVDGELRELVAASDGFALLLHDRIVRLTANGAPSVTVPLPTGFQPYDIDAQGSELLIAGWLPGGPAVARVQQATAAVIAQIDDARSSIPRLAARGGEILLTWTSTPTPVEPYNYNSWDLYATRIHANGTIDAPQRLREKVDLSGRWLTPIDLPLAERIGDTWIVVWSEGPRAPSFASRDLFSATFSETPTAVTDPTLLTFRASDRFLAGTALFADVLLTVWSEYERVGYELRRHVYATRRGLDGRRIDAEPIEIGAFEPRLVRATDTGFLVAGDGTRVKIGTGGPAVVESHATPLADLSCANGLCIAVWVENASVVFAEWQNGDLVTAPMVVHTSDRPYFDVQLASNGESFLLAFAREGTPGGTILASAHIQHTADGWTHRVSDFAAAPALFYNLRLGAGADRYVALWTTNYAGQRGAYLTFDGRSMDGEETGWEGWRIETNTITDLAFDGARTILITSDWRKQILHELRGRAPALVGQVEANLASIECAADGRCVLVYQNEMTGDPWYRAYRVFTQAFTFARPRAVRH